jgi:hypothetical protein
MKIFFNFGEKVEGFDYPVINEREARASAGIMFLLGMLSIFSVYLERTLFWVEIFSLTIIVEFFVRTIFSPLFAPYMLLGRLIVSNQTPEWVEAKPKQFAWFLGLILGLIMTYYILFDIVSLVRLSICWLCLFLMFVESAFGICLGCLLYKALNKKSEKCAAGVCDVSSKRGIKLIHLGFVVFFIGLFTTFYISLKSTKYLNRPNVIIIENEPIKKPISGEGTKDYTLKAGS